MIAQLKLIWTVLSNKYLLGAVGAGLLIAAVWVYGAAQYAEGKRDAAMAFERQQRDLAAAQQLEKDRADAKYRGEVLARQEAEKRWAGELASAEQRLRMLRQQLQNSNHCARLDDSGEDWIGILGESWAAYQAMANEAGRLADKVNGLQGAVRALQVGSKNQ